MSSYEFSTRNLRDFSSGVFKTNAAKLAQIVSEAMASNQIIEIQDLFMKSTLDSVFNVVLGVDLDSMRGTNEEGTQFSKAFDEASEMTFYRYIDISWPIKQFLNIGSEAKLKNCVKIVDEFVYKVIRNKIQQVHKPNDNLQANKGDILSRFLEMNETDPKYLKDIILSFIIAGKDTTASTLSWFFYMMCKHPLIQEKIAKEVREATKLQENPSIDEMANSITEEALDKMQFLHAAITETLRLYPVLPLDGKMCFSDDTFPDGFSIKKGNLISYQPWAMGRMKSLWGEDAEEFRPQRWLNEHGDFQPESSFKFTAFQAGPRICIGKEFAYRQMKVFAAVLLGVFSFKLSDEKKAVNYRTMLTLQIDGGLHLRAAHRFGH
ncbi:Cytochrome [Forsythia ovata]|uniref:Cytochrome n=1 Tax=Forsythia ovata TaxID=205694 RepID=A0ABD1WPH5_9LAMI